MKVFNFIILLIIVLSMQACGGGSTWYRKNWTQRDFDINSKECENIAKDQALAQSELGDRVSPDIYSLDYDRCLRNMGWVKISAQKQQVNSSTSRKTTTGSRKLCSIDNRTINGLGLTITIPESFHLLSRKRKYFASTLTDHLLWGAENKVFINIIFQQGEGDAWFPLTDYSVPDGYRIYAEDNDHTMKQPLQWAAFSAHLANGWVKGLGGDIFTGKKKRCVIVVTSALPAPVGTPLAGFSLTDNQHRDMENFLKIWQPWLQGIIPPKTLWQRFWRLNNME